MNIPKIEYKPVETQFEGNGHVYRQMKRDKNIAMYSVTSLTTKNLLGFEVVIIRKRGQKRFPNGIVYEPMEYYPETSQFGKYGWYYMKIQKETADRKYQSLLNAGALPV